MLDAQVIQLCESKTDVEYILVDTPGQIEIFTWSASGAIVTEVRAPQLLVTTVGPHYVRLCEMLVYYARCATREARYCSFIHQIRTVD